MMVLVCFLLSTYVNTTAHHPLFLQDSNTIGRIFLSIRRLHASQKESTCQKEGSEEGKESCEESRQKSEESGKKSREKESRKKGSEEKSGKEEKEIIVFFLNRKNAPLSGAFLVFGVQYTVTLCFSLDLDS